MANNVQVALNSDFQQVTLPMDLAFGEHILQRIRLEADSELGARGCNGWWINVPNDLEQAEMAYLAIEIYPGGRVDNVEINRIDALARFSVREA